MNEEEMKKLCQGDLIYYISNKTHPMETSPKDGSVIILMCEYDISLAFWDKFCEMWCEPWDDCMEIEWEPLEWHVFGEKLFDV